MPYFVVTAKEKKLGSKRRRKIVVEAAGMESARAAFIDKCRNLDFEPNLVTLRQITRIEHDAVIATLMGKKVFKVITICIYFSFFAGQHPFRVRMR